MLFRLNCLLIKNYDKKRFSKLTIHSSNREIRHTVAKSSLLKVSPCWFIHQLHKNLKAPHPLSFEWNFVRSSPSKVFRRARNWIIRWLATDFQWVTPTPCLRVHLLTTNHLGVIHVIHFQFHASKSMLFKLNWFLRKAWTDWHSPMAWYPLKYQYNIKARPA